MKKITMLFYTLVLVGMSILTGCSSKSENGLVLKDSFRNQTESNAEIEFDSNESMEELKADETQSSKEQIRVENNRKLIQSVYLSVETKAFDDFQLSIQNQIKTIGGYIESSEITGNSYFEEDNLRYSNLVLRIPVKNLEHFIKYIDNESNILRQSSTQEDITLKYIDTQSHNKSLKIEQERLLLLLSKAEKLPDIITLEERLSQVRYEIETYESELRTYDNLVDYSTVTMDIEEVSQITPTIHKTIGERIKTGLSMNIKQIQINIQDIVVLFIISLPYLIIWAIIIAVISLIASKLMKKRKQKILLKQTVFEDKNIVKKEEQKKS